nr:dicarboxylate/amino acid:cation symporter [Maliibacterium massiliense]
MKEKKKRGLTSKIFIGLVAGIVVGLILNYTPASYVRDEVILGGVLYVAGQVFIAIIKMLVVPLVFVSIVCGACSMGDTKKLGRIGGKTLLLYMATTCVAIALALGVSTLIRPGVGLDMSALATTQTTVGEATPLTEVLIGIIPTNPVQALAEGNMLQVIFFALLTGICLSLAEKKVQGLISLFVQINEVMMTMVRVVMRFAPIGVFALIATNFAQLGFDMMLPLGKYMFSVLLSLVLHTLVIYGGILLLFGRLNPWRFFKKYTPVMGLGFSTATSNATIPLAIQTLDKRMGVSTSISSFTIPLGATINMDGTAIMQGCAVVFIAQLYGVQLGLGGYLTVIMTATLASIGTAGVPGVGLITLSMVLSSVGLPVEGVAFIMGIDRILDMARTAVNITGDAVVTTVVAKSEGEFVQSVYDRMEKPEAPSVS